VSKLVELALEGREPFPVRA